VTVRVALLVTPAPVAEIVTVVGDGGGCVSTKNPPDVTPAGTVTYRGTLAYAGCVLDNRIWTSWLWADAILTVPEAPSWKAAELRSSVSDVGATCGVRVSGALTVEPRYVAEIVTDLSDATLLVGNETSPPKNPSGIVKLAGG
jgi:hypothetical protein